jgi:peptide/nickel transport system permease protein
MRKKITDLLSGSMKTLQLLARNKMGLIGLLLLLLFATAALFAPFLNTRDPRERDIANRLRPPCSEFWLGTDYLGRDIWSQVIYGSRISLTVGLISTFLAVVAGSLIGLTSGFHGGIIDEAFMRVVDVFLMLPELPLMIILSAVLGRSLWNVIFVISLVSWTGTARVVRSQVLSIKERPYVESARCIGASDASLMFVEILPNVVPIVLAQAALIVVEAIYAQSVLSFLGLGDPLSVSWGMMLNLAFESGVMSMAPWWPLPPIMGIILLILAFSFLGSAINDVLKPESKGR